MNIWIINHYAMPPHYEARVRTNMMAKYLQRLGHTVKIFSSSTIHNTNINLITGKSELYIEKKYDELNFVHIRTSDYSGNGLSRIINMLQFPMRLFKVVNFIDNRPDVIICDLGAMLAPIPYFIAKRKKAKFVLEVRDLWPESIVEYKGLSRSNLLVKAMYRLEKWMYKKSDQLIFTMEGGKDYIINKGWNKSIDMSKIHHINNGVELATFNSNKLEHVYSDNDLDDNTTFKVIYAGSIRLANNVRKIVDTANIIDKSGVSNIKFLIFGDGSDRESLEKYCMENSIQNVKFKGHVEKNKIPYILSKSDLNILHFEQNSLKKYGVSLNKMFEYFASGKPTVSDCEFAYDLINRYNAGIVVDNASAEQLAEAVMKFYKMNELEYKSFCMNAEIAAHDYDFEVLVKKIETILVN